MYEILVRFERDRERGAEIYRGFKKFYVLKIIKRLILGNDFFGICFKKQILEPRKSELLDQYWDSYGFQTKYKQYQ